MAGVALPSVGAPVAPDATYNALAAELAHSYEGVLAGDQEKGADETATFRANQSKLDFAQPLAQRNVMDKANAEGLLTSGVEGQRSQQQAQAYGTARNVLGVTHQENMDAINRSESEAAGKYRDSMVTAGVQDEGRRQTEAEKQAEKAPTLGAPAPTAPAAPALPTVAGSRPQPITASAPAARRDVVAKLKAKARI